MSALGHHNRARGLSCAGAFVFALIFAASPASAATIAVTTTAPTVDPNDGACSLREAIAAAQDDRPSSAVRGECAAGSGADTIVLARRARYDLTEADNFMQGANGLPAITSDTTIEGRGAVIERALDAPDMRLFTVLAGHLTLAAMTLRGGRASGDDGGAGGAIYSQGFLTLTGVTLADNLATGADAFGGPLGTSFGGAIANDHGTLVLANSTLTANSAGGGVGGAVFNLDGPAVVANSTLVGNAAAAGGALYDLGADGGQAAASAPPATVTLFNSILAGSLDAQADVVADQPASLPDGGGPNLQRAAVYASAPNIVQRSSTVGAGLFEGTPIAADPQLGPLEDHGGTGVATLEPGPGSPALGAGQSPGCPETDARGRLRPPGACDLGAHEDDPAAAPRVRRSLPSSSAFLVVPAHSSPIPGLERAAPARRYNPSNLSHCYQLVPLRQPDFLRDARGQIVTRRDGQPFLPLQGLVAITPLEALQTPRGVEYQLWGPPSQPLTYSGGVLASALARTPTPLSPAELARCRRGSGRPAPDLRRHGHVVSYRIEPRSIPARMAYLGAGGLVPYQNYGRFFAQDAIERAGVRPALDYTPLAWSWVVAPWRCSPPSGRCRNVGGGIARAMLRRGARFVPSAVQPIVSLSVTDPRSWVTAVYGRASSGDERIYGWLVAAHHDGAGGRTVRHLACLRC